MSNCHTADHSINGRGVTDVPVEADPGMADLDFHGGSKFKRPPTIQEIYYLAKHHELPASLKRVLVNPQ